MQQQSIFNPNNITINLAFYYASDQSMLSTAEGVAAVVDFNTFCTDACNHKSDPHGQLHIRINDINSGKGVDYFLHE